MDQEIEDLTSFSWSGWLAGFLLGALVGSAANLIGGFAALSVQSSALGLLLGAAPGLLLACLAIYGLKHARSLALGVLTSAGILALIGGMCGFSLAGGIR